MAVALWEGGLPVEESDHSRVRAPNHGWMSFQPVGPYGVGFGRVLLPIMRPFKIRCHLKSAKELQVVFGKTFGAVPLF